MNRHRIGLLIVVAVISFATLSAPAPTSLRLAAAGSPSWSSGFDLGWLDTPTSTLPWSSLTVLIDFSAVTSPKRDGTLDLNAHNLTAAGMLADVTAAHQHGKLALLSVGGADDFNWDAACNSTNRARFAANLVALVARSGYDGADMDVEQDFGGPNYVDYAACMAGVRSALKANSPSALLTADGDPDWQAAMISHAASSFDENQVMSYWSSPGGTLSAEVANYTSRGMPASKLVLGFGTQPSSDPTVADQTAAECTAKMNYLASIKAAGAMNFYVTTASPCTNAIASLLGSPPPTSPSPTPTASPSPSPSASPSPSPASNPSPSALPSPSPSPPPQTFTCIVLMGGSMTLSTCTGTHSP